MERSLRSAFQIFARTDEPFAERVQGGDRCTSRNVISTAFTQAAVRGRSDRG